MHIIVRHYKDTKYILYKSATVILTKYKASLFNSIIKVNCEKTSQNPF